MSASNLSPGIPTIDFEDFPSQSPNLLRASEDWGCFRLINHPIPLKLMAGMKATVRALLDLPTQIKSRNRDVIPGSGYVAPSQGNPLYEALGLYDAGSAEAVEGFCSQLEASPSQREIILEYSKAVHELTIDIGWKLCQVLGLDTNLLKEWVSQFRINKYNFTPECIGSSGVQIHTDSGFLTILQDDDRVGGLEVLDEKSGEFVAIDPLPGSLLVNFGDVATAWSNGRFCNVKHRVQCREASVRISIALFLLGPKEGAVEAPPQLVGAGQPRIFVPFTVESYRQLRLSTRMRAGEALALLHQEETT